MPTGVTLSTTAGGCCASYGVTCSGNTITQLDWSNGNPALNGTISLYIGKLVGLTYLSFDTNAMTGPIPAEFSNLTALIQLNFASNFFSGAIPPSLSALTNLTFLSFFNNSLTSGLPASLSALTKLQQLSFSTNQLNGTIPASYGALVYLTNLFLFNNQLTGTHKVTVGSIPTELSFLTALTSLELGSNFLSGAIPPALSLLTNLKYLNFYNNAFTSGLPASLSALTKLQQLSFSYNQLNGTIPASYGALIQLNNLYLDSNHLTGIFQLNLGSIPVELSSLTALTQLTFASNFLSGAIPPALSMLTNLTYLNFYNNTFTSGLPASLSALTKLQRLDFSYNQLNGTIPPSYGALTKLTTFSLTSNHFIGYSPNATSYSSVTSGNYYSNMWMSSLTWTVPSLTATISAGSSLTITPTILFSDTPTYNVASLILKFYLYNDTACTNPSTTAVNNGIATTNITGYASFQYLNVTAVGTFYYNVIGTYAISSCVGPLVITAGIPASIVYTTQPSGLVSAGSAFAVQPTLIVKDAYGNAVLGNSVGLAAFEDSACSVSSTGILSYGTASTTSLGVAQFTSVSSVKAGSAFVCSVANVTIFPLITYGDIYIPDTSDPTTGLIPLTSLLITDIYGNVVSGKFVTIYLYTDANCTYKSSQAVISGNNATTNSSGYATYNNLKIETAGTYYVGTTVEGVRSQCAIKPLIVAPLRSKSLSTGVIVGITAAVGLTIILSVALALKWFKLWPFNRYPNQPQNSNQTVQSRKKTPLLGSSYESGPSIKVLKANDFFI